MKQLSCILFILAVMLLPNWAFGQGEGGAGEEEICSYYKIGETYAETQPVYDPSVDIICTEVIEMTPREYYEGECNLPDNQYTYMYSDVDVDPPYVTDCHPDYNDEQTSHCEQDAIDEDDECTEECSYYYGIEIVACAFSGPAYMFCLSAASTAYAGCLLFCSDDYNDAIDNCHNW